SLRILSDLVNVDKHRLPLLTFGRADTNRIQVFAPHMPSASAQVTKGGVIGQMTVTYGLVPEDFDEHGQHQTIPTVRISREELVKLKRKAFFKRNAKPLANKVKVQGQTTVYVAFRDPG